MIELSWQCDKKKQRCGFYETGFADFPIIVTVKKIATESYDDQAVISNEP